MINIRIPTASLYHRKIHYFSHLSWWFLCLEWYVDASGSDMIYDRPTACTSFTWLRSSCSILVLGPDSMQRFVMRWFVPKLSCTGTRHLSWVEFYAHRCSWNEDSWVQNSPDIWYDNVCSGGLSRRAEHEVERSVLIERVEVIFARLGAQHGFNIYLRTNNTP